VDTDGAELIRLPIGTDHRGLHLKPPHGELIADGVKVQIAKAKPFDLSGPWILISGGKAYGTMEVGLPEAISAEQFDRAFGQHRVSTAERKKWWTGKETLYLSEITSFTPFDRSMDIQVVPGMQTVVETVEFKGTEPDLSEHCEQVRLAIEEASMKIETIETDEIVIGPVATSAEIVVIEDAKVYSEPPAKIRGMPEKAQRIWVHAYNSAIDKYPDDEARCHKIAYGAVKNAGYYQDEDDNWHAKKELGEGQGVDGPRQGVGGTDTCACPKCGHEVEHERGTPCAENTCPKCGAAMTGKASKGVVAWLKEKFDGILDGLREPPKLGITFKAADGRTWLLTWTTNAFIDKEEEIFRTKAIEDYVDAHIDDEVKGDFWFWHLPGAKMGQIEWQAVVGRFLVEAGPFDDTPIGRKMAEFFSQHPHDHPDVAPEGWGTSHGFKYVDADRADKIYDWFAKFETTVLPKSAASNQHSPQMEVLPMNQQQKDALSAIAGDDFVNMVIKTGEERTKELEERGIAFKETAADEQTKEVAVEAKPKEETKEIEENKEAEPAATGDEEETSQTKAISALAQEIVAGLNLGQMTEAIKSIQDTMVTIAGSQKEQGDRLKALEDIGGGQAAPLIPLPAAAYWQASRVAQTEPEEKLADKAQPQLPDAIVQMAQRMPI